MIYVGFVLFSLINILCLNVAGYIIKKYLRRFPNKMIPLLNTITAIIVTCVGGVISHHNHTFLFCAHTGLIYGLASVGLHQVIKQTVDYFNICRYIRSKKKEQSHIVSMSD